MDSRASSHGDVPLWRNVSFLLMWSSVAASGFSDRVLQLAAWSMLGIRASDSDAASVQAAVSFFFFLPYVLLGPGAGWIADTLPRKWVLLFCDEARAGVLLLAMLVAPAGVAAAVPGNQTWKVYLLVSIVGALAAVFSPAKAATIPQIVPTRHLQPANAIVLGIAVIASLIGFQIGGPIVEQASVQGGLLLAVLAYSISGTFFAFLRPRAHVRAPVANPPSQWRRFLEAAVYLREHRAVLNLTLLSVLFWMAGTAVMAAVAALCKTVYLVPAARVISHTSTMLAVLGAGMLASSLWVAWANSRRESAWFVMIALILAGMGTLGLAWAKSYGVGLLLSFSVGFWGNTAMICVATLTQSLSPDYIRGRVFGVRDLMVTLSAVMVNFLIWRLPGADGYMVTVLAVVGSVLCVVAGRGLYRELSTGPMPTRTRNCLWRLCRAYTLVWHRLEWVGRHHVPAHGGVILAANHTTGVDPFLIQAALPRTIRWVMARPYRYRILEPLWRIIDPIAIDQDGGDLAQLRAMIRTVKSGFALGIFPEGGAQRKHRELKPFQPGIGLLAARGGVPIVPVWIQGTPQTQHMLWHFLKPSRSVVVFGRPIQPSDHLSHQEIADHLRAAILALSETAGDHAAHRGIKR